MANDRSKPYLIFYAHEPEAEGLRRLVAESGLGSIVDLRRWRDQSDPLLDTDAPGPAVILNVGFAGRLNPELDLGEVVLVSPRPFAPARRFAEAKGIRQASLVTVASPVLDEEEGADLRRRTGADIVDMEARHLFVHAEDRRLPFISFKLVSDNADAAAWDTIRSRRGEWSQRLGAVVVQFLTTVRGADESHCRNPGL